MFDLVERNGLDELLEFLKEKNYFKIPASIKYHSNIEGGLAYHSLLVLNEYTKIINYVNADISRESAIITALLHDTCKIDQYEQCEPDNPTEKQINYLNNLLLKHDVKLEKELVNYSKLYISDLIDWLKNDPGSDRPKELPDWRQKTKKEFPFSHGEKSIYIAEKFIELKRNEMLAIRYHMGAWENKIHHNNSAYKQLNIARDDFPDVSLISIADELATHREDWGKYINLENIQLHI